MQILLVEDEPFKAKRIVEVLAALGADRIEQAGSVQQAIQKISDRDFGLVVLDISLPSHQFGSDAGNPFPLPVGGLDIAFQLQVDGRTSKVVILTQYPTISFNRVPVPLQSFIEVARASGLGNIEAVIEFSPGGGWEDRLVSVSEGLK